MTGLYQICYYRDSSFSELTAGMSDLFRALSCPPFLLPERDYVTFGYLLSQIRLSSVCHLSS